MEKGEEVEDERKEETGYGRGLRWRRERRGRMSGRKKRDMDED